MSGDIMEHTCCVYTGIRNRCSMVNIYFICDSISILTLNIDINMKNEILCVESAFFQNDEELTKNFDSLTTFIVQTCDSHLYKLIPW